MSVSRRLTKSVWWTDKSESGMKVGNMTMVKQCVRQSDTSTYDRVCVCVSAGRQSSGSIGNGEFSCFKIPEHNDACSRQE